jgi:hypothetical protein
MCEFTFYRPTPPSSTPQQLLFRSDTQDTKIHCVDSQQFVYSVYTPKQMFLRVNIQDTNYK